jgi:hypothetical protein
MTRIATLFLILLAFAALAQDTPAPAPAPAGESSVVIVYYFHRVNRCAGCRHAEAATTEALKENFAAEMEKGTVKFASVAVDGKDEGEKVLAEEFGAFGPSLFLEVKKGGKTEKVTLDKMWDMIGKGDPAYKTWVAESVKKQL